MNELTRFFNQELEPFDILIKNFFDTSSRFSPVSDFKMNFPCDIEETENGLEISIAVPGINKEDIEISKTDDILRVTYQNKNEDGDGNKKDQRNYLQKSIARRSFNFGWKISDKFDLSKIEANMDKGLLLIEIPKAATKIIKKEIIKIK